MYLDGNVSGTMTGKLIVASGYISDAKVDCLEVNFRTAHQLPPDTNKR